MTADWRIFALGSAAFAALTAVFGKVGVSELNSNMATLIRTLVILMFTALLVGLRGEWQRPGNLSMRGVMFLIASALATGMSWLCYYRALQLAPASRVAPVDKLSVVLVVVFGAIFLHEQLTWKVGVGAVFVTLGAVIMVM